LVEGAASGCVKAHSRYGNHRRAWTARPQFLDQRKAVNPQHENIDYRQIETGCLELFQGGRPAVDTDRFQILGLERKHDRSSHVALVVDHQDARHGSIL
jgi:hypothetical protein